MARIHTNHICTITELREPQKVLAASGGKPVAVMKNSKCVAYLVPAEATLEEKPRHATTEEVRASLAKRKEINAEILDYLKDK